MPPRRSGVELVAAFHMLLVFSSFLLYASFVFLRLRSNVIEPQRRIQPDTPDAMAHWRPGLDDPSTYQAIETWQRSARNLTSNNPRALVLNPTQHAGSSYFHRRILDNILYNQLDVKIFDEDQLKENFTSIERLGKLRSFIKGISVNDSVYIHTDFKVSGGRYQMKNNDFFKPLTIMFIRDPAVALLSSYHTFKLQKNIFRDYDNYTIADYEDHLKVFSKSFNNCIQKGKLCLKSVVVDMASFCRLLCKRCKEMERRFDARNLFIFAKDYVLSRSDDFLAIPIEQPVDRITGMLETLSPFVCEKLDDLFDSPRVPRPVWTRVNFEELFSIDEIINKNQYFEKECLFNSWIHERYHIMEIRTSWQW